MHQTEQKAIGCFCCFVPDEIITALGMIPFRIQGNQTDPIEDTKALLEQMACPLAD